MRCGVVRGRIAPCASQAERMPGRVAMCRRFWFAERVTLGCCASAGAETLEEALDRIAQATAGVRDF